MTGTVTIREKDTSVGRMLVVDEPFLTAVQIPASEYRLEEWRIVAQLGLPPAVVHSEPDARAWLEYLAGGAVGEGLST